VIDFDKMQASEITLVGAGASADLAVALARCGVGKFNLIDPDRVAMLNISRQGHYADEVGRLKVEAVAAAIRRVNAAARINCLPVDFLAMTDEQIDAVLGTTDLFIFATDRFAAQARGNEVASRLNKLAIWIGLYAGGSAGEIAWWAPHIDACFRCLFAKRYAAHAQAAEAGRSLDPPSDGCTIFDVSLLDSIAGMLAIGLLTRGSDNRFGRLIDQLGDRNFVQVQLDPQWKLNGRNIVREQLGIADDCQAFFSWNAIVRADSDRGQLPCPDCERFRGHQFDERDGQPVRIR
jgi:molybdopterin/thiamine biosynthesis adenylyltransferase